MNFVINWIFKTVVGRWVTAGLVTLLLGGSALKWHNYKESLIHKGQQVCVQEINKETVSQLEAALAEEREARALLRVQLENAAQENASAVARRQELETSLTALAAQMAEQERTDETYKAWTDSRLPSGVAERLRQQAAGTD